MAPEQKMAWFMILVFAAAFIAFGVFIPLFGVPLALVAFSVLALAFLTPLIPRVFRNKRGPSEVVEDERDKMIAHKATLSGAMLSYGTFIFGCMIPWFIYQCKGEEMISIHVLPQIVCTGGIVFFLARSIAILAMYGRAGKDRGD
ncbi:MAG: hypothetical protein ACYTF1_12985 [Planctomycetota bacterium]